MQNNKNPIYFVQEVVYLPGKVSQVFSAISRNLISEEDVVVHCAYGSSKDVSVYSGLGLKPEEIYIVGKSSKKLTGQATFLQDG